MSRVTTLARIGPLVAVMLLTAATAHAQSPTNDELNAQFDAYVKARWIAMIAEAAAADKLPIIMERRLGGSVADRTAAYQRVITALQKDEALNNFFDEAYVQRLINERAEARMPVTVNGGTTNPASAMATEKSGATSLVALATDLSSLVRADKSAVSINISGLALVSAKNPNVYSSIAAYQDHAFARRFSGTVVFGAKIPEKEITGLSSLPTFDTLLDAFAWDVKVRVWGDKDIRSGRWTDATVRRAGLLGQMSAVLGSWVLAPQPGLKPDEEVKLLVEERNVLLPLLGEAVRTEVSGILARVARSPQLALKVAGTHLTKEEGKNKYSASALFDIGMGPADFTANAQYAVTDDVRLGLRRLFQVKAWTLAASLTAHLAPDAIIRGRSIDWNTGFSASIFQDAESLPVAADNTWKLTSSIEIPVAGGGRIPVAIVYSNDPNALVKQNYVSGQIGLSYDFSALKQILKK